MSEEMEQLLAGLPLREPPAALDARIAAEAAGARRRRMWRRLGSGLAGAGMAAGLAIAVLLISTGPEGDAPPPPAVGEAQPSGPEAPQAHQGDLRQPEDSAYEPSEHLYGELDYAGVVVFEDDGAWEVFHRRTVRRVDWTDEQTGGRYELTVPRNEILLVRAYH